MPVPALHLQGCDLQDVLYGLLQEPIGDAFLPFGLKPADELIATDLDGTDKRFAVTLVDATPNMPTSVGLTVFRGTKYKSEWESDAEAWLDGNPWGPGKVHHGFKGIGSTMRLKSGRPLEWLKTGFEVTRVMGHSLGGPEATILASQIAADELICYASPKPGDIAFGAWVRSRVQRITLYENSADLVPKLPLTVDDPLDRFDFWQVKGTILMDARTCVPPVVIAAATDEDPIQRAVHDLEIAHSTTLSYKPLIAALP